MSKIYLEAIIRVTVEKMDHVKISDVIDNLCVDLADDPWKLKADVVDFAIDSCSVVKQE